jgi:hypothetical protein
MKRYAVLLLLACAVTFPTLVSAEQIKAYVAEFTVTPGDAAGLKSTLQTLLSSRMASDGVAPVATAAEADVVISGSYTQFGKVFSLDAAAKDRSGRLVANAFEQGDSQDELIPAVGRISGKLKAGIQQGYQKPVQAAPALATPPAAATPSAPAAPPVAAPASQPATSQAAAVDQRGKTVWVSQRIPGALDALAPGLTTAQGRELFVADAHLLRAYRQEKNLQLLDEVTFSNNEKVIAIDSLLEPGSAPRIYVSIIAGDIPASRIYSFEKGKLTQIAAKLPYLFRAIAFNGGKSRIYAQQLGVGEDDFYGDLFEVGSGSVQVIELKNPIKLPRYANVYNYNRISGPDGGSYATVFSSGGYLIIYSESGEEVWRSEEKFSGSETFFQRETSNSVRDPEGKVRWRFIDQRITVTKNGEIIVPQNSGFFVVGNSRSYSRHAWLGFTWNGSSLEETWRTTTAPNYLADYYLDEATGELVTLEVVQKEGAFTKGGSAVRVIRAR